MFTIGIGQSEGIDTRSTVDSVIEQCRRQLGKCMPQAGIVLAGIDFDHKKMLALILSSFPEIELTGCTTAGTFSSYYGFSEDSISLILFSSDSIEIKTGIGWNATERPVEAAVSALNSARKNLTKKERLCLVFPDGYSNATSEVINALNKQLNSGCALFGGSSGRHATTRMRPLQFFRNEVVEDALPILLFGGPIEYSFDVCNSWKPIGRRKKITKSDGNVIKQIGKQNALDYYHKYLGKHSRPDYEFPLAVFERPRGDSFYIRVPTAYDESEGNLTLGPPGLSMILNDL